MSYPADIFRKFAASPTFSAEDELELGSKFCGAQKELLDSALAVREAITHKSQVAPQLGIRCYRIVSVRVEAVVYRNAVLCSQSPVVINYRVATSVSKNKIVPWD
jgi:hypothetical protein